jgi:hypothetical protein
MINSDSPLIQADVIGQKFIAFRMRTTIVKTDFAVSLRDRGGNIHRTRFTAN